MSIVGNWQINGSNPSTVGGTGTTSKYFNSPSANFTSGVSTTPNSTNAFGQLPVRGDNEFNGQRFVVEASGDFQVGPGGACPSVTFDLQANTGTITSPTYTTIATSGAVTAQTNTGVSYPWALVATITGTTAAGTISGTQTWVVDNTVGVNNGALTSVLSGLNFLGGGTLNNLPVFGLVMRVTFSVSEPGNKANLYYFVVSGS
jgi:hypothetical protein